MAWGSGGWGSASWGASGVRAPLLVEPARVDIGLFVYTPTVRRATEFTFTPTNGPTTGGIDLTFQGSALDMTSCTPALDSLGGWTVVTSGSGGVASGVLLSTGDTPGSEAGVRSLDAAAYLDVSAILQSEVVEATSGVLGELALRVDATTRFAVQATVGGRLRLLTTVDGQTTADLDIGAAARNPQLRLLRYAGNRVLVFAGGELVVEAVWTDALANTEVLIRNAGTSAGRIQTALLSYVRRPVITFGGLPVTTLRIVDDTVTIGGLPPAENLMPRRVNVGVTGCTPGEDVSNVQFVYLNPFEYRVGVEPTKNRLTVIGDF